jgi:hypothetical protein
MVSWRYNNLKFIYTDDFNTNTLKAQREFKDENGNPFISVTSSFRERQVDIPEKVETNFNGERLRRLIAYTDATPSDNISELQQFIPYNQPDKITQQIKEILEKPQVICGDYRGENSGNQRRLNQQ